MTFAEKAIFPMLALISVCAVMEWWDAGFLITGVMVCVIINDMVNRIYRD